MRTLSCGFFDEIVRFESTLDGAGIQVWDNMIRIPCSLLVLYEDHPLRPEFGERNRKEGLYLIFEDAKSSQIKIQPFEQTEAFGAAQMLPQEEIVISEALSQSSTASKVFDLCDFLITNPRNDIKMATVLNWTIVAKEFYICLDE